MRLPAILAAVLLAAGGLAGCFGDDPETTTPAADSGNGDDNGVLPGTGTPDLSTIKVLAALRTAVETSAPQWVKSGTAIDVAATAPAQAKGDVTYTWAVGPMPGTVAIEAKADTGSAKAEQYIQPGSSASIKYTEAGVYRMHCHPHPFMLHNVTVVEGFQGPASVEVLIVDGAKQGEYRYVPEEILVGVGTTVTYKNVGQQPHTSTAMSQEPPLKKADLSAQSGQVVVEGEGWQRVVVIATDKDGRIGSAEHHVYVTSELPAFEPKTETFTFTVGGAPNEADAPQTATFKLDQGGKLFVNWTVSDPASSGLSEAELHVVKQGETQDTLTGDASPGDNLVTTAAAGTYTLSVKATQGIQPTVTVTIEAVYDLVPPPMTDAAAGGDDGHGGHHH